MSGRACVGRLSCTRVYDRSRQSESTTSHTTSARHSRPTTPGAGRFGDVSPAEPTATDLPHSPLRWSCPHREVTKVEHTGGATEGRRPLQTEGGGGGAHYPAEADGPVPRTWRRGGEGRGRSGPPGPRLELEGWAGPHRPCRGVNTAGTHPSSRPLTHHTLGAHRRTAHTTQSTHHITHTHTTHTPHTPYTPYQLAHDHLRRHR